MIYDGAANLYWAILIELNSPCKSKSAQYSSEHEIWNSD